VLTPLHISKTTRFGPLYRNERMCWHAWALMPSGAGMRCLGTKRTQQACTAVVEAAPAAKVFQRPRSAQAST
jgi:hypothetical protein